MNSLSGLWSLYNPVQPTVRPDDGRVMYKEYPPAANLRPFIYCYWELKSVVPLSDDFAYRVVADGCTDVFFDVQQPGDSFVMGFCDRFTQFQLPESFHYGGIRFLPTAFSVLFRIHASELANRCEKVETVVPVLGGLISRALSEPFSAGHLKDRLDDLMSAVVSRGTDLQDPRLCEAVSAILKSRGVINLERDLDIALSPRQLRRLFDQYIGGPPKTFSKVIRFQNVLRAKPSSGSLRLNKLFFDTGYYDQSHFIKEFRTFYGDPPGAVMY